MILVKIGTNIFICITIKKLNEIKKIISGIPSKLILNQNSKKFEINDFIDHENIVLTISLDIDIPKNYTNINDYI